MLPVMNPQNVAHLRNEWLGFYFFSDTKQDFDPAEGD